MPGTTKGVTSVEDSDTLQSVLKARLREVRGVLRKSQKEMDGLLGIGTGSWQRYERVGQAPGSKVIAALIAQGFNANWLLSGDGPMLREEPGDAPEDSVMIFLLDELKITRMELVNRHAEIKQLMHENNDLRGQLMEMNIDPERDFVVRVLGLAECSMSGWYVFTNTTFHTVAPPDMAKSKESFVVIAIGDSMIPAGIEPGFLVFCDPLLEPNVGDAVFIERTDGHATIKLYGGEQEKSGKQWLVMQGWLPRKEEDPDAPQTPFIQEEPMDLFKRIVPVVYVKRRP